MDSETFINSLPSIAFINSPFSFNNFKAFQFFGLWLAVIIIPASAFSSVTAISTVGVVDKPKQITSIPKLTRVSTTIFSTIGPEILASLPTTIFPVFIFLFLTKIVTNEDVNLTISLVVKSSPSISPIVPRIPEIDLINGIIVVLANINDFIFCYDIWICKLLIGF